MADSVHRPDVVPNTASLAVGTYQGSWVFKSDTTGDSVAIGLTLNIVP